MIQSRANAIVKAYEEYFNFIKTLCSKYKLNYLCIPKFWRDEKRYTSR